MASHLVGVVRTSGILARAPVSCQGRVATPSPSCSHGWPRARRRGAAAVEQRDRNWQENQTRPGHGHAPTNGDALAFGEGLGSSRANAPAVPPGSGRTRPSVATTMASAREVRGLGPSHPGRLPARAHPRDRWPTCRGITSHREFVSCSRMATNLYHPRCKPLRRSMVSRGKCRHTVRRLVRRVEQGHRPALVNRRERGGQPGRAAPITSTVTDRVLE